MIVNKSMTEALIDRIFWMGPMVQKLVAKAHDGVNLARDERDFVREYITAHGAVLRKHPTEIVTAYREMLASLFLLFPQDDSIRRLEVLAGELAHRERHEEDILYARIGLIGEMDEVLNFEFMRASLDYGDSFYGWMAEFVPAVTNVVGWDKDSIGRFTDWIKANAAAYDFTTLGEPDPFWQALPGQMG